MKEAKIDVAVLILFFNRPKLLEKVFEQVRIARPSKLYLYQDGAREGREDDVENIQRCREVVADIDWECEVHKNYQEKNSGCDPSEYLAQKWMFETEEMGIVLEDDDVPSQSFFPFCKELLEKYKDDQRINMICGMNNCEVSEHCPYDYLFSTSGSITGWASWKRVIDEWSEHIDFVDNEYIVSQFKTVYGNRIDVDKYINHCKKCNDSGIAYYEAILSGNALPQGRLNIVPTKNLISNIGNEGESTHGVASLDLLPKGIRRIFNMKTYEYEFPLKHPPFVLEDMEFLKRIKRIMGNGYPLVRFYRKCESIIYRMRAGDFSMWKRWINKLVRKK